MSSASTAGSSAAAPAAASAESSSGTGGMFPAQDVRTSHLIYELLDALHELLTEASITYWLDGGTALGCARHQGIIPWDDDADVSVFDCDRDRLEKTVVQRVHQHHTHSAASSADAASAATGVPSSPCALSRLEFLPTFFGWKLCDRSSPLIAGHPWRYPSVDIFFVRLATPPLQRLAFTGERAQKCWGYMNWQASEILLPPEPIAGAASTAAPSPPHADSDDESDPSASAPQLSYSSSRTTLLLYPFGPLRLYAPPLPSLEAYLGRCYGADWSTVAYRIFDHAREQKHDKATQRVRVALTPEDRKPAATNGPLASMRCACPPPP